ncbi:MAG: hypothetical protein ACOZAI_01035 [Pseudomonadota bacterium]
MSKSRFLAPWALPLWGLLLLALLAWLAPRQTGKFAEQALPGVLVEVSRSLQGQATLEAYARGWRNARARILLTHAGLRDPVALEVNLRHGPWLGEEGFGWLSARIPWPEQGGIVPFPPGERLELRLRIDLLGRARLCLWRLTGKTSDKLGEVRIEINAVRNGVGSPQGDPRRAESKDGFRRDLASLIGETRLPGLLLNSSRGEVRLAEVDLRLRLERQEGRLAGIIGLDARRAALGRGDGAWLIEQPWLDLTLGERDNDVLGNGAGTRSVTRRAESTDGFSRLELRWTGVRGGQIQGPLHVAMRWRDVNWTALRASLDRRALRLNDPQRMRRQLDRLGLALGEGEIVLERLALEQPSGRLDLEGLLRGREAASGLRRLHLDLRLGMERPVAVQLLRASRWVQDEAAAERLIAALREQHILVDDDTMLRGALTLWDGALTLSGRPMVLEDVLAPPLNSDGMD